MDPCKAFMAFISSLFISEKENNEAIDELIIYFNVNKKVFYIKK